MKLPVHGLRPRYSARHGLEARATVVVLESQTYFFLTLGWACLVTAENVRLSVAVCFDWWKRTEEPPLGTDFLDATVFFTVLACVCNGPTTVAADVPPPALPTEAAELKGAVVIVDACGTIPAVAAVAKRVIKIDDVAGLTVCARAVEVLVA